MNAFGCTNYKTIIDYVNWLFPDSVNLLKVCKTLFSIYEELVCNWRGLLKDCSELEITGTVNNVTEVKHVFCNNMWRNKIK